VPRADSGSGPVPEGRDPDGYDRLRRRALWSLPTALALLAWYIFAPQCASTLAVVKRETNSWRWPAFLFVYMLTLAYAAAYLTYHIANWVLG